MLHGIKTDLLLVLYCPGLTASLLAMGISFYGTDPIQPLLAMVGLSFYMAFYGIGLGPTSRLIPVEIFPTSVRAQALAVAAIISRGTVAVLSSTLLSLKDAISWPEVFLGLAALCWLTGGFLLYFLPETKNLPLEEMSLQFAEITGDTPIIEAERSLREEENNMQSFGASFNKHRLRQGGTRLFRA